MTAKVSKLERASLTDPVKVEVHSKHHTVSELQQHYVFLPLKHKDAYLVTVLNNVVGKTVIVFTSSCTNALKVSLLLRNLGFEAIPLHGQMSQDKRLKALNSFKAGTSRILLATDVASR